MLSEKLASFEKAFDTLNRIYFENKLSKSVVTIYPTPGAYGHFSCQKIWQNNDKNYHEINLGAADIARPLDEVIATLIHEMVHQYCAENNIKDTSRGTTYHNKRFFAEAEARGLVIDRHPSYGWSLTKPSAGLRALVAGGAFSEVERELHRREASAKPKATDDDEPHKKSWHRYDCPNCGVWVRSNDEVRLICAKCNVEMHEQQ